jgi:hypothetical protein
MPQMDGRMPRSTLNTLPLSAILRAVAERPEPTVSIAELTELFGGRALGALLLVFGLLCTLPLPPGSTTVLGAPLVLLAPQLVIGARAPWLPRRLRERTLETGHLRRGLPGVLIWLERMEAVSRPRLPILFGAVGERAIGLVCTLLALVLILPIPLGNMLPAAAVSVLSLALVQRDGALALFGYLLAGLSGSVLVLAAGLISRGAHHVISVITAA